MYETLWTTDRNFSTCPIPAEGARVPTREERAAARAEVSVVGGRVSA
ncbi:hypothetical protein AB0J86_01455 [Micromonospora sp. NPDC049559]